MCSLTSTWCLNSRQKLSCFNKFLEICRFCMKTKWNEGRACPVFLRPPFDVFLFFLPRGLGKCWYLGRQGRSDRQSQLLFQILVLCGCRPETSYGMNPTMVFVCLVCPIQMCNVFLYASICLMFFPFWWHNEPERAMAETCLFLKNHVWWTCVSLFVCSFVC